eukprot:gene10802-12006_t
MSEPSSSSSSSDFELPRFPRYLYYQYRANQEVPSHITEKLRYQYEVLAELSRRDGKLSSTLCRSFMTYCLYEGIALPEWIRSRFCNSCFALLLPSITSDARLVHRERKSRANQHKKPKMKTELIISCRQCGEIVKREGAFLRQRLEASPATPAKGPPLTPASATTPQPLPSALKSSSTKLANSYLNTPKVTKFSFRDKVSSFTGKDTKPGIGQLKVGPAFGATSLDASRRKSAPAKLEDSDFIAFDSSSPLGMKRGIQNNNTAGAAPTGSAVPNLLELERLNKKKRRKTMHGGQEA